MALSAGEFLLRGGSAEHASRAEACFRRAIDVATEQQAKSWKLRAIVSLARLYERRGRRKDAHRIVAETYASFTQGMETADLREAAALLDG